MSNANPAIVWVDCEMTGLSLDHDALIEIAVVVTDFDLKVLDPGIDLLIAPPPETLASMVPVVREMHTTSGLLRDLEHGLTMAEARAQVMDYVRTWVPEPGKSPLAGNSVGTDRGFIARDLPELDSYLHYRIIDVSSIKELTRRWYPRAYFAAPEKTGGHRALGDIMDSIRELQYYRSTVFVPQPGPDSTTAKALAQQFTPARP